MSELGYTAEIPAGYDEAVTRVRLAFRAEGFSILSEMHVGGMLGPEAGAERQYLIMGVWNAAVEDRAIGGSDMRVAVHLPCNVVIQETGETSLVAALDPVDMLDAPDPTSVEASETAREALARVLEKAAAAR